MRRASSGTSEPGILSYLLESNSRLSNLVLKRNEKKEKGKIEKLKAKNLRKRILSRVCGVVCEEDGRGKCKVACQQHNPHHKVRSVTEQTKILRLWKESRRKMKKEEKEDERVDVNKDVFFQKDWKDFLHLLTVAQESHSYRERKKREGRRKKGPSSRSRCPPGSAGSDAWLKGRRGEREQFLANRKEPLFSFFVFFCLFCLFLHLFCLLLCFFLPAAPFVQLYYYHYLFHVAGRL